MDASQLSLSRDDGRTSATDRIVHAVTDAIVGHRLRPGAHLAEQKLADVFGVSRTVVRQALLQLARDKLVTLEPARGAHVAMPTVEEVHQVFDVRRMLEGQLIERFARVVTDGQIGQLRGHIAAEQAALARTDVPGRTRLLGDFHVVIARMFGNQVLTEMLAELAARTSLISLLYQSSRSAAESSAEHVRIVDALERRDAAAAVECMCGHLEDVELNLRLDPRAPDLGAALLNL